MEITFTLSLPRDGQSVPLVRRITGDSLGVLGVEADCVSDIQVALSEACSNVLKHSGAEDDYEVNVVIRDRLATLEVLDRGPASTPSGWAGPTRRRPRRVGVGSSSCVPWSTR